MFRPAGSGNTYIYVIAMVYAVNDVVDPSRVQTIKESILAMAMDVRFVRIRTPAGFIPKSRDLLILLN